MASNQVEVKEDISIEFVKKDRSSSKRTNISDLIKLTKKRSISAIEQTSNGGDVQSENKKKKKMKGKSKSEAKSGSIDPADEERNIYPYDVVPDDHCESPVEAYQDISGLLTLCSQQISKSNESLFIYDPYFCEGSMKERMLSLGFPNVYNQKEDFYNKIITNEIPKYDVLVTNPPYSLQHMEKLLDFVFQSQKPFCLLVPNYVYMKEYYDQLLKLHSSRFVNKQTPVFYICPKVGRRYLYSTPKGRRQQKSSKLTSPFPTFWYCGNFRTDMIQKLQDQLQQSTTIYKDYTIAMNKHQIPLEVAPDNDERKKKLRNNLKRKKNKQRKQGNNP